MSSLPDVFRTIHSEYLRPEKQGGIYTIKYGPRQYESCEKMQPEQFYSVKWTKATESRIGTSHTIRSQKVASVAHTRNIASSQSQRKVEFRKSYSRPSSQSIRKDIFANYGSSRVSFAIGQTAPPPVEEAQSLIHQLNENAKEAKLCEQQLNETIKLGCMIDEELKRIDFVVRRQIQQMEQNVEGELARLRGMLSNLRRISGMETKVNKTDVREVEQNLKTIGIVMDQIDDQSMEMFQMCLK